jgi:uncharacterized repeat protein (TIGR01451 family)
MRKQHKAAVAFAALAITSAALAAPPAGQALALDDAHAAAKVQQVATTKGLATPGAIRSRHARPIVLAAPAIPKLQAASKALPLQVGFGRDVAALGDDAATAAALDWSALDDGSTVAAVRITSTGAASVRAALRPTRLPDAAIVRFQAPGDAEVFEIAGADVNAAVARNAASGDTSADARLYWSPLVAGDTLLVEVQLPRGVEPGDMRLAVPALSHLVTSAAKNFAVPDKSAACEVDAMCSASPTEMNAVARMLFTSGASTFLCTGTLLADMDASSTVPYFLSANHCISTQASASSLATFWFYRSAACNATSAGAFVELAGGATLLYASSAADATYTDTSFMRLNSLPPAGAVYAGWSATQASVGTSVTGLHHPGGDWLKVSEGTVTNDWRCTMPTNGQFTCDTAGAPGFYSVGWQLGITEPGSSGSGLFRDDGTLVGQLYGGSGTCTSPADDLYGRFDLAYNAALKQWLASQTLTVSKAGTGAGTVTSTPAGINCGSACSASLPSGTSVTLSAVPAAGSLFKGWSGACTQAAGVCVVALNAAESVTATFTSASAVLSVSNTGGGTVTSNPAGINCGASCSANFTLGSAVVLTATPAAGMTFTGWGGACSGTGTCAFTMAAAKSVTASFVGTSADLSISQSASPASPTTGKDVTFALTAANAGPSLATNVAISQTLPAGWNVVWMSPGCSASGASVTCSLISLPPGLSQMFTVVARPAAGGSATAVATIAATEIDNLPANNSSSVAMTVSDAPAANVIQRYRLYSPVTLEHHFTTDLNEYTVLGTMGWVQEGGAGKVLDNPGAFNGVVAVPYYRLYNTITRWHHWTTDPNEYYTLTTYPGWNGEGVDGYILPTSTTGATQLFRLVYPNGTGLHHWTIDANEYSTLIAVYGWVGEGGAGFVVQ